MSQFYLGTNYQLSQPHVIFAIYQARIMASPSQRCKDQTQRAVNSVSTTVGTLPLTSLSRVHSGCCVPVCEGLPWTSCLAERPPALTSCDLKEQGLEQVTDPEIPPEAERAWLVERQSQGGNTFKTSLHASCHSSAALHVCLSQELTLLEPSPERGSVGPGRGGMEL